MSELAVPPATFDVAKWMKTHPPPVCSAASISQPTRVGVGWTKDGENYSHGDCSGLEALRLPLELPVDLNEGVERHKPKTPGAHAGVEILLREAAAAEAFLSSCDVLTFRNNMNKIMGTVFEPENAWMVAACFPALVEEGGNSIAAAGPLFVDIVKSEEGYRGPDNDKFVAWGYQFEARCTGAASSDANCEYGALLKLRLSGCSSAGGAPSQSLRIFMGAEIDAYDPADVPNGQHQEDAAQQRPPPLTSLREIKSYTMPEHRGQYRTLYRRRHPKWWLQSYLAGVPKLVLGARDREGFVREINVVSTADLPRISRKNGELWDPCQAMAFGCDVLLWMRAVCQAAAGQHVVFVYDGQSQSVGYNIESDGNLPGRVLVATASAASKKQKNI